MTIWFATRTNFKHSKAKRVKLWNELNTLSGKVKSVVNDCFPFAKVIGQLFKNESHIFLLGLGLGECTAREGSLKMKELTYKHC